MDTLTYLLETQGFFTRAQALECGLDDKLLAFMVRSGEWMRFRRGYYCLVSTWASLDDAGRHLLRCAAVWHSLGPNVALSHVSSLVCHGIDPWGMSLDRVHVTRLDGGAGRIEGDVVHHEGLAIDGDIVNVDNRLLIVPERSVIEAATQTTPEAALTLFDGVLHHQLCNPDQLHGRFALMAHWPRTQHLHVPIRMADGRTASIGESRGRWLFWSQGVPRPEPQFKVYDANGRLVGTCDWGWPELKLLGEFDGELKYGRLLKPGQDPGAVVFAEKQREDELREVTGCAMVRLIWADYGRPRLTAQRIRRLMRRAG